MTWLLDTNACIRYLNGRAPGLKRRVDAAQPADLVVCSVVKAELYFGAARSNNPTRALAAQRAFLASFLSLPFDDRCAEAYAAIRSAPAIMAQPIGTNDLLIAAIAVAHGVTLVTHNVTEFARVPGLAWDDWEAP